MSGSRVLVTGASGFVGANLARRLLADGCEVHLLLRPGFSTWRLAPILDQAHVHTADLGDATAVAAAVGAAAPEWTFSLAAHGAYSWEQDLSLMSRANLEGTVNVVRASIDAGCRGVVHAGSSSEYGYRDHPPREDERISPNSNYAVTKAAATHFCQLISRQTGVPVTTLRLYSVYGAYEDPARLIPTVIRHGLAGSLPPLANPRSARDFIYVDDVSEAFVTAANAVTEPGVVLNVASERQVSLAEVAGAARKLFGINAEAEWGAFEDRPWDTDCWVGDSSALRALGWEPRVGFDQGLAATAAWWDANRDLFASPSAAATGVLAPV